MSEEEPQEGRAPRHPFTTPMTAHARYRMQSRAIPDDAIEATLTYGRRVITRGAEVCAIGRKEVVKFARLGVDLSRFEGVQVVLSGDGAVITVYRNRNFRWLKTGMGRGRFRGSTGHPPH